MAPSVIDEMTAAKVKTEINIDNALKDSNIEVECERGVVYLRGKVGSEALKKRATQAAWRVQQVIRVSNELKI